MESWIFICRLRIKEEKKLNEYDKGHTRVKLERRITEGNRNPGGKQGTLLMANRERSPENENKGDR